MTNVIFFFNEGFPFEILILVVGQVQMREISHPKTLQGKVQIGYNVFVIIIANETIFLVCVLLQPLFFAMEENVFCDHCLKNLRERECLNFTRLWTK